MATAKTAVLIAMLGLGPVGILWLLCHRRLPRWGDPRRGRWTNRARLGLVALVPPAPTSPPASRPIEDIAVHVRRLGLRYHNLHPHTPFAKVQGVQAAYDGALGECCQALGLPHLLGVLAPGPDLDVERTRVEVRLAASGFVFPDAA